MSKRFPLVLTGGTFSELISAAGCDSIGVDVIEANFPLKSDGVNPKQIISSRVERFGMSLREKVIRDLLAAKKLRPGTTREFLEFCAQCPEAARDGPIAALDAMWLTPFERRDVLCIGQGTGGKHLGTAWLDAEWGGTWSFFAMPIGDGNTAST